MAEKNRWFRVYSEITKDRKLRRYTPATRWTWIAILCMANDSPKRGYLLLADEVPATIEDLADESALSVRETEEAIATFLKQGMLEKDGDVLYVVKWNDRQYKSDVSTDRVKRFRNTHVNVSETPDETTLKRCSNVSETDQIADSRVQIAEDLPPTPSLPPEIIDEVSSEREQQLDQLIEVWKKCKMGIVHLKKMGKRGLYKIRDELNDRLDTGWSYDEIVEQMEHYYSEDPTPWGLFERKYDNGYEYGPGKKWKTREEYLAWIKSSV